jgi:hypothetical protein
MRSRVEEAMIYCAAIACTLVIRLLGTFLWGDPPEV